MRQGQQHRRGRSRNNNGGPNTHHQGHNGNSNGNNNNRKGQNPLTRSFESNGPDVKIRGTPAHVAEKYVALARDAHSVGDPVLAENYLQHAEHYYRIILAYREQQGETGPAGTNAMRPRPSGDPSIDGEFSDDDADEFNGDGQPIARGQEPQPGSFETPRFDAQRNEERPYRDNNNPRHQNNRHNNRDRQPSDRQDGNEPRRFQNDRPDFRSQEMRGPDTRSQGQDNRGPDNRGPDNRGQDTRGDGRSDNRRDHHQPYRSEGRQDRFERPDRSPDRVIDRNGEQPLPGNRAEPEQRPRFERPDRGERVERPERPERVERAETSDRPVVAAPIEPAAVAPDAPRRREPRAAPVPSHEQPEFLRRPVVRRPRREAAAEAADDAPAASDDSSSAE